MRYAQIGLPEYRDSSIRMGEVISSTRVKSTVYHGLMFMQSKNDSIPLTKTFVI